jgi:glycosyltransferase involved in cell wall biosynthesis
VKCGVIAFPLDRPVGGGIDRYVHRLAHEFSNGPHADEFGWIHGVPFGTGAKGFGREVILKEHGMSAALARRRWSRANKEGLEVLFGPYFGVLPGPFAKVMTVHDLYAFTSTDAGALWTIRFRAATRRMARISDWIIADSEASRKQVIEYLRVPPERVVTVWLGVDPVAPMTEAERTFARAELRKAHGWPTDTRVVLFVGALIPRKDPILLLRAFAKAHAKRPDTRLLFVGATTRATPPLRAEAARLGVLDAIAMPGPATEGGLRGAYAGSDVFALPSRFEGFGLPVLEAMAHGLPVACSTAGSLPEVVGDAAATFPAGDEKALREALESILDDEAAAKGFAQLGRDRARPFTWARCAEQTYAVLERASRR